MDKDLALQIDSLHSAHSDLEKDLDSLKAASKPGKEELDRLEELKKIMRDEEKEIGRIMAGSKNLKEMVGFKMFVLLISFAAFIVVQLNVACCLRSVYHYAIKGQHRQTSPWYF